MLLILSAVSPGFARAEPAALPAAPVPAPAAASESRVTAAVTQAQKVYGPPRRQRCGVPGESGEIVVCADRGERWRVPPTSETDPDSPGAVNDGVPRAPDFAKLPGCARRRCGGWAPPPVYMIDVTAIPEAPADSDADRIARGELAAP